MICWSLTLKRAHFYFRSDFGVLHAVSFGLLFINPWKALIWFASDYQGIPVSFFSYHAGYLRFLLQSFRLLIKNLQYSQLISQSRDLRTPSFSVKTLSKLSVGHYKLFQSFHFFSVWKSNFWKISIYILLLSSLILLTIS